MTTDTATTLVEYAIIQCGPKTFRIAYRHASPGPFTAYKASYRSLYQVQSALKALQAGRWSITS